MNRGAVVGALPPRTVIRALNDPVAQVEAAALQLIHLGYGITATSKSMQEASAARASSTG